ncbi:MAG: hypothetical protein ISQ14_12315, partial [Verrucomicrobiae bacterium]|nr:hypothetical protein [Verrucomicrobiae bacterium]
MKRILTLSLLGISLSLPLSTHAAALSPEATAAIRAELKGLIDEGFYPGASILLIHEGQVVMREAHGVVDIDSKRPFT